MAMETQQILSELLNNLEQVNVLREELKNLTMISDVDTRQRVAIAKGLPIETFYYIPYRVWSKISKRYLRNFETMYKHIEAFQTFTGEDYQKTPYKYWYADFGVWAKANNIRWF